LKENIWIDFKEENEDDLIIKQFNDLFKTNFEICFDNVEDYIEKNFLQETPREELLREYNIKSCCNIPIYYACKLLDYVVIQYTNEYKEVSKTELAYLKTMATQIGIAINQSAH